MLIDWFTVVAQGLNFLVLVWLLKRYLYKPVLAAIDAREKQIALAIAAAASQRTAAEQERAAFAAKKAALDSDGATLLKQAANAAAAQRERLLADARSESQALRAKQMTALQDDQARLSQGITHLAQQEVLAIARKVLRDLADASLEARMAAVFAQRLRNLDASAKQTLAAASGSPPDAVVCSGFDLSEAQRAVIQTAIDEVFSRPVALRFEISPEMLCGVELVAGGQKVAWSMTDYLGVLDQKMASLIATQRVASSGTPSPAPISPTSPIPAVATEPRP